MPAINRSAKATPPPTPTPRATALDDGAPAASVELVAGAVEAGDVPVVVAVADGLAAVLAVLLLVVNVEEDAVAMELVVAALVLWSGGSVVVGLGLIVPFGVMKK
jgi:hypothetical protein